MCASVLPLAGDMPATAVEMVSHCLRLSDRICSLMSTVFIPLHLQACNHRDPTYIHTYIHTFFLFHSYIHTYIHTFFSVLFRSCYNS